MQDARSDDGGALPLPWRCLSQPPTRPSAVPVTVTSRHRFLRLFTEAPVVGMPVEACERFEVDAASPDAGSPLRCVGPLAQGTTDAAGYVALALPGGKTAALALRPSSSFPDMLPVLTDLPAKYESDDGAREISTAEAQHLLSVADVELLASVVGVSIDRSLGAVLALGVDCDGKPASGMSARLAAPGPTTAGYYVVAGVPSTTATETGERGELGFFNVPPGQASVTLAVPSSGLSLGTRNLPVAPGTITMSGFGPRL